MGRTDAIVQQRMDHSINDCGMVAYVTCGVVPSVCVNKKQPFWLFFLFIVSWIEVIVHQEL